MQLELEKHPMESLPTEVLREAKRMGFSDVASPEPGVWMAKRPGKVRHFRKKHGLKPVYKRVDTCAAEFESYTPYLYSTYEEEDEATPTAKKKVIILGSGPNRIGQELNSILLLPRQLRPARRWLRDHHDQLQPRDGLDRLRHQRPPLLRAAPLEDVFAVCEHEASGGAPVGVIVQFGGQTPLNLSLPLKRRE